MGEISAAQLALVTSFPKLIQLLRDKLDWPIGEDYGFDDIVYEYEADDLGLKENEVAKIREIHQLRPLVTGQPWGIFFISFEEKSISVTVLRRILRALVVKKRAGAQTPNRQTWDLHDLIFVTNFGRSGEREIAFAHFSDTEGDLPVLNVLGWNAKDTTLHNDYVGHVLGERLRWPDHTADQEKWRETWSKAFELRLGEVARTSQDLARQLAGLASNIRASANELLAAESDKGPMRQLLSAFRKNLIHDLDEDGFADMFAQTISYGMLAARISRPMGIIADNLADMVPKTNPFLKELFANFLKIGGRGARQAMDFDELGVRSIVDMLNAANMQAVLRDFGDRNPKEDPVIHFYELFLKEYDPKKRMQRGVFYTPRPVVNFIVRGVDEILRTEFGLPLGLADTSTWAQVVARNDRIKVPAHVKPDTPFVQILDPATGTGTFLVEVIDLIHQRMENHWKAEGKSDTEIKVAWNAYVPAHLLPRLTAFELMMAPYTIAHMKVGLKLSETGYNFGSDERARIFLSNALEPAHDLDGGFNFLSEALAHEAIASNAAKSEAAFVVIVGNPPYATLSSNGGAFIRGLMQDYKTSLGGEIQVQALSNDYAKFFRIAEYFRDKSGVGIIGYISDNSYLDGILFKDFRTRLVNDTNGVNIVDLGGNNRRLGAAEEDEGVFDIRQGTSILLTRLLPNSPSKAPSIVRLAGKREYKYDALARSGLGDFQYSNFLEFGPNLADSGSPTTSAAEKSNSLSDIFSAETRGARKLSVFGAGIATRHDNFAVSFSVEEQVGKLRDFMDPQNAELLLRQRYGLCSTAHFSFRLAKQVGFDEARGSIRPVLYRPFDWRVMAYHDRLVGEFRHEVFRNIDAEHLALLTTRRVTGGGFSHSLVTDGLAEYKAATHDRNTQVFPLFIKGDETGLAIQATRPNINEDFARMFGSDMGLFYLNRSPIGTIKVSGNNKALREDTLDAPWDGRGDLTDNFGPRDLFDYIYAVLHSPGYRRRYAEFLESDFPRIPTPKNSATFAALASIGRQLVGLHLLRSEEAPVLDAPDIRFAGTGVARVERGYPEYQNGKVMVSATRWFEDVPRETWEFHVGGYQVCEKWLKDRAGKGGKNPSPGRVLTGEDILHYRRVVTALTETRRLMVEVDRVIDEHGGWPGAFAVPLASPPSIEEIIEADESLELEFKATFQWDVKEGKQNKDLQKSVLKTLAAFMNTEGGTLVIGVTDDKGIHGLEDDLTLTRNSVDVFEQNVLSAFSNTIGVAYVQHLSIRFADAAGGKKVCVIEAAPSPEPVFLEFQGKHEFYVRRGNASVALNPSEQHTYIRQHFKAP